MRRGSRLTGSWDRSRLDAFLEDWPNSAHAAAARDQLAAIDAEVADATREATALQDAFASNAGLAACRASPAGIWRAPQAATIAFATATRCRLALETDDRVATLEAQSLGRWTEVTGFSELARLRDTTSEPEVVARVEAETQRRLRAFAQCAEQGDPGATTPKPQVWMVALPPPVDGGAPLEGFLSAEVPVTLRVRCREAPPVEEGAGVTFGEAYLGEVSGHDAVLIGARIDPDALASEVVAGAALSATCDGLGPYDPVSLLSQWDGTGKRSGRTLSFSFRVVEEGDAHLAASMVSLMTIPAGLGTVSATAMRDDDLIERSICFAFGLRAQLGTSRLTLPAPAAVPDAPPGVPLLADPPLPADLAASAVWDGVQTIQLEVSLVQLTEQLDKYGARTPGDPKRVRTGRMVLSLDQFRNNDWESIQALVNEKGAVRASAERAVLARYVTSWQTW